MKKTKKKGQERAWMGSKGERGKTRKEMGDRTRKRGCGEKRGSFIERTDLALF